MNIGVRPAALNDLSFIFSTWLKSYKVDSQFAKRIKHDIYFRAHHKVIERILLRPTTTTHIAHLPGEPDVIVGYLVTEQTDEFIIHYAYTKEAWQLEGIQTALFARANVPESYLISHWTASCDFLPINKGKIFYDPYRA